jgi:5-methylcytosine-specific restriction endonuclease McrA
MSARFERLLAKFKEREKERHKREALAEDKRRAKLAAEAKATKAKVAERKRAKKLRGPTRRELFERQRRAARKKRYEIWRWQRDNEIRANAAFRAKERARLHPEQARMSARLAHNKRRARLRGAPGNHNSQDLAEKLEQQQGLCANPYCAIKLEKFHADHITPLFLGGSNAASNIQLLCPHCNVRKGRRTMEAFLASCRRDVKIGGRYY